MLLMCPSTLPTTILHTACSHSMSPRQERWKIKCIYTVTRDAKSSKPKGGENHSKVPTLSLCSGSSKTMASQCERGHRVDLKTNAIASQRERGHRVDLDGLI